jgi:hypothetical protein
MMYICIHTYMRETHTHTHTHIYIYIHTYIYIYIYIYISHTHQDVNGDSVRDFAAVGIPSGGTLPYVYIEFGRNSAFESEVLFSNTNNRGFVVRCESCHQDSQFGLSVTALGVCANMIAITSVFSTCVHRPKGLCVTALGARANMTATVCLFV